MSKLYLKKYNTSTSKCGIFTSGTVNAKEMEGIHMEINEEKFIIANDNGEQIGDSYESYNEADSVLSDWLIEHDDLDNTTYYEVL